jgi:hypothetical protein
LDLYTSTATIVGWAMKNHLRVDLPLAAKMAISMLLAHIPNACSSIGYISRIEIELKAA